jgi:ribose transport system substrate-binding protein
VSAIVTYPDFGDAMIPVFQQATKAGIPVSTYAWGYVTGPGTNYTTVVGEDTCNLGKSFAYVMNTQVKSGNIAFLGGFPGNPLSLGWQKCEQAALNSSIHVVANDPTNWDPSKVQGIVAGILAKYPDLKGISYEDALFMSQGGYAAYKAAGIPYKGVFTYRTDESAMGCLADKLKDPALKVFYYTAGNSQIRVALTADMMKLAGAKIPPTMVLPIELQNQATRDMCTKGYPDTASPTSLIPLSLLHQMYP